MEKRNNSVRYFPLMVVNAVFFLALVLFALPYEVRGDDVNVQVDAGFGQDGETPPQLQLPAPPDVVAVPSGESAIYMVPNMTGVYFFGGVWYRNYGGLWFRASDYNAEWAPVVVDMVPQVIIGVPPEYPMYLPPSYHRVHYHEFHDHWRNWDRERHWQKQEWFRNEGRSDVRRGRFNRIETDRKNRTRRDDGRIRGKDGNGRDVDRRGKIDGRGKGTIDKSTINKGNINKGNINKGNIEKGNINKGNINKGNINKGNINKGNINKGNINKGNINKGNINKGNINNSNINNGNINKGNINRGNINKGNINRGNINKGNINKGNINKGNINKANINKGNINKGAGHTGNINKGAGQHQQH